MVQHRFTELKATVDRTRRQWPDILRWGSSCGSGYLLSQGVLDNIKEAGMTGIEMVSSVVLQLAPNQEIDEQIQYYSFELSRGLDLDLQASELASKTVVCFRCFQILDGGFITNRYVPLVKSWSKIDIFMLRRPHVGRLFLFCTRRVLELAREKRWQGFRFEPIDVERKYSSGWKGIDYLGKKWPPELWYPKPPSEGRSPGAWLEMYNSVQDGGEWWDAWSALLDLGEEVLPLVIRQFEGEDHIDRMRAARLIGALHKIAGVKVPEDVLSEAKALWPDPLTHPPAPA